MDKYYTKIYDCEGDETENLKYGDIFTINSDKNTSNWQMTMNGNEPKKFRLIPRR